MPRILIGFFLLASLFIPPAAAQEMPAQAVPPVETQTGPEMHSLQSKAIAQQPSAAPESQDFQNLKQNLIPAPDPLEQKTVPSVHMGQTVLDQQIIKEPGLGNMPREWGVVSPSPPPQPAPAPLPKGAASAAAQNTDFSELRQGDSAVGEQVIDPLRVRMKDGRIVQLAGIDIPDLDPYDPGPVSLAARNMLKEMLEGRQIRLYVTKNAGSGRVSRLGDIMAHLQVHDGGYWVQGALLAAGLARVRPSQRNPEMAVAMMKLEEKARAEKKGLWADPRYAVLTPETAAKGENGWAIVEGTVYNATLNRNTVYLDFGPDWHTDFTIAISGDVRREISRTGLDPLSLSGKRISVRGWLRDYNGPYMELDNPVWLQIQGLPPANVNPPQAAQDTKSN